MFVVGIGSHLKVSNIDPRVCFGNELTNLSVRKSFLSRYIKSSHPSVKVLQASTLKPATCAALVVVSK